MTQASSEPTRDRRAPSAPARRKVARRFGIVVGLAIVLALVLGGALLAAHNGLFARGPAVDAASSYLSAIQRRDYASAYRNLAPDLRAHETEAAFAASMDEIVAANGALSSYYVRDQHGGATSAVVTVELTRTVRGTFTVHVQLTRVGGSVWQISALDDL